MTTEQESLVNILKRHQGADALREAYLAQQAVVHLRTENPTYNQILRISRLCKRIKKWIIKTGQLSYKVNCDQIAEMHQADIPILRELGYTVDLGIFGMFPGVKWPRCVISIKIETDGKVEFVTTSPFDPEFGMYNKPLKSSAFGAPAVSFKGNMLP